MTSLRSVRPRVRAALAPALGLTLLGVGGCSAVDVDPAGDLQKASDLVAERSAWKPSWSTSAADDTTTWDGRSPLAADQAVVVALQNNRELRAALEDIAGAKADLAQSGLLPNPTLGL